MRSADTSPGTQAEEEAVECRLVPLTVCHDDDRRWIVVRASACVSIGEMVDLIRTVRADVARRMVPMLFDARGATTDATEADIAQAVAAVRNAQRQGRRGHAAIVADDDVFFARMLMYETECAEIGVRVIRVFRQLADAEKWLQIVSAARHFG